MQAPYPAGQAAFATPWGPVLLGWGPRGLTRVRLPDPAAPHHAADPAPDAVQAAAALLAGYLDGAPTDFRVLALDTTGLSEADRAIYAALREVPAGDTLTYGELARRAGLGAGAARAVGVAMAKNPWPVVVPCHRVMAADGALHGFSAPGGLDTKRRLLRLEGVELDGQRLAGASPLLPGLLPEG